MGRAEHDQEFEQFVRSSWPILRQAAFALTGSTEEAEDLLQGVLAKVYVRWARVRHDNPVAYVRRALVNSYIDTWRRRRVLREEPTDELPQEPSYDADTRHEERGDLAQRLAALSPRERTMVVMRHYLDLSEQDVARALGCSVGTVKSTCSRALQRLRIPSLTTREEQP